LYAFQGYKGTGYTTEKAKELLELKVDSVERFKLNFNPKNEPVWEIF
jgi:hypothetical protein